MMELQLGWVELGDRCGTLLVTTHKWGQEGQNGRSLRVAKHKSSEELPLVYGNPSAGNKDL